MKSQRIRKLLHIVRYTPLHPQWFAYKYEKKRHQQTGSLATGNVLDIGCGRKPLLDHLNPNTTYYSLDYLDNNESLYNSRPDTFGDAKYLPFSDEKFNTVVMLEVLEHIDNPDQALSEACRVLAQDGYLILSAPFLYPIHDAPYDFHRLSYYGFESMLRRFPLETEKIVSVGFPLETAALLLNLSLSWVTLKSHLLFKLPLMLLTVLLVPTVNVFSYVLSRVITTAKSPFPIGYFVVARKR